MTVMTKAQWDAWPLYKKEFFAKLFTSYMIDVDGVLRVDTEARRNLIREQMELPDPILPMGSAANFIITNYTGGPIENAEIVLSLRGSTDRMKSCCNYDNEEINFDAFNEPTQFSLLGGFVKPGDSTEAHFKNMLKTKMIPETAPNGFRLSQIQDNPQCTRISQYTDVSFPSRVALHPEELNYFLEDVTVLRTIDKEVKRLIKQQQNAYQRTLDQTALRESMIEHIRLCSTVKSNQKPLAEISVAAVEAYTATYQEGRNYYYLKNTSQSNRADLPNNTSFVGYSSKIRNLLAEGALRFTFAPEYLSILKFYFKSTAYDFNQLRNLLISITNEQITSILTGNFPAPPAHMGTEWDLRVSPKAVLCYLRSMTKLSSLVELSGRSPQDVHTFLGIDKFTLQTLENEIEKCWEEREPELIAFIERTLVSFKTNNDPVHQLTSDKQTSGITLTFQPYQYVENNQILFADNPKPVSAKASPKAAPKHPVAATEAKPEAKDNVDEANDFNQFW